MKPTCSTCAEWDAPKNVSGDCLSWSARTLGGVDITVANFGCIFHRPQYVPKWYEPILACGALFLRAVTPGSTRR